MIVVSEETGIVSVAHRGRLQRGVTPDRLQHILAAGALPGENGGAPVVTRAPDAPAQT